MTHSSGNKFLLVLRVLPSFEGELSNMNPSKDIVLLEDRMRELEHDLYRILQERYGAVDVFELRRKFRSLEIVLREYPDSVSYDLPSPLQHRIQKGRGGAVLRRLENEEFDLNFDELREVRLRVIQLLGLLKISTFQKEGKHTSHFLQVAMKDFYRMGSRHMHYLAKELYFYFKSRPYALLPIELYEQFSEYTVEWLRKMELEIIRKSDAFEAGE